jgi:hypothetical protein
MPFDNYAAIAAWVRAEASRRAVPPQDSPVHPPTSVKPSAPAPLPALQDARSKAHGELVPADEPERRGRRWLPRQVRRLADRFRPSARDGGTPRRRKR